MNPIAHPYSFDKILDEYLSNTIELKVDGLLQLMVSSDLLYVLQIPSYIVLADCLVSKASMILSLKVIISVSIF